MRICIVGTSHIAALKLAEKSATAVGLQCTFFGAAAPAFRKVYVEEGILRGEDSIRDHLLRTSDGRYERIDPADFDAILFHGIDMHPPAMTLSIARSNRGANVLFSQDFLRAGIKGWLERTRTFKLAKEILGRSGARIILSPVPCPAAAGEDNVPEARLKAVRPRVLDIIDEVTVSHGMTFLRQPEETYSEHYYTKREYSTGSVRLVDMNREHPEDDHTHMNAAYGALVMRRAAALLDQRRLSPLEVATA